MATDRIVGTIDSVREKTTDKVEVAARALVYGVVAAMLGLAALVLAVTLGFRLVYVYLGNAPWIRERAGRSVWLVDLAVGVFLCLAGLALQRKGRRASSD
jgi:hypothetical protein